MFPSRRTTLGGDVFRDEYSLAFDGTDDYIDISDDSSLDITDAITVCAWVKPTATGWHGIVSKSDLSTSEDAWDFYLRTSINTVRMQVTTSNIAESTTQLSLNKWYFLTGTYDGANVKVYVDGVLEGTNARTAAIPTNNEPLKIGIYYNTSNAFQGNISEVSIYNSALTSSQVKTIYNGREPYNHKEGVASGNLLSWWRMGDGNIDKFNLIGDNVNPTMGSDLVTDGGFDGDGSAWTVDNFSIGSGVATTSTNGASIQQSLSISTGDMIKIVAEIKNYTSGSIRYYTGAGIDVSRSFSSDGVHTHYLIANSTKVLFYSDNFNGSIDNVKVYKVNGNAGAMINMVSDDFTGDTP